MVNAMVSTVSLGTLLVAGTALAQSPGPSVGSADIVPVTGPSTVPGPPDPVLDAVEAPVRAQVGKGETGKAVGTRAGSASRVSVASRSAAHGVKTVRKPAATAAAKKASASKHATKTAGRSAKAKGVAAPKRATSVHHAARPSSPAKQRAPAQPLLPRV